MAAAFVLLIAANCPIFILEYIVNKKGITAVFIYFLFLTFDF